MDLCIIKHYIYAKHIFLGKKISHTFAFSPAQAEIVPVKDNLHLLSFLVFGNERVDSWIANFVMLYYEQINACKIKKDFNLLTASPKDYSKYRYY